MANIFISNGTCYSAAGERLHESFIPCGNAAVGHQSCCGARDNCLKNGACFGIHGSGYGSWLTYQAGCTDPNYEHESCPKKQFDQPWIALTHCDNSNGAWAPCSQSGNPTTLQPGSFCSCTDAAKTTLAFRDTDPIASLASLPGSTGQSIQYFVTPDPATGGGSAGPTTGSSNPTQTGSETTSAGDSSRGSSSSSGAQQTGTAPPNSDTPGSESGPSSGTKIAIGVGVTVGVLILLAAIAALFFLRRRRGRSRDEIEGSASEKKPGNNRTSGVSTTPTMSEADGNPVSEVGGTKARPWSMRSELEGSQVVKDESGGRMTPANHIHGDHGRGELSPVAELPGNNTWNQEARR
ncbi:hypothetical protein QBC34DRAFT_102454 [Podospora aff. communis PSN243]|uniref:Uncharacterized protein n=1 Tax=Podospora aff. communis PSN243 TaxID=3040156 RepID=A0AAV9GLF1_9PEZI|nr:hypothetical protein QBC34DRAFT_102454 [Podospora aff. communis PSN243]